MNRAIYARVSTPRQAQTQTIEQQLQRLCETFEAHGWELPSACIFRDDGFSGTSLNRPGLDRLREAVTRREIEHVLITAPDRLARNYVQQVLLLDEFERAGCQIEFLDRPMSQDPHDQLLLQIRGAVAEYERMLVADRMRRGRQAKLQAGLLLPWTKVPYGYRVDPDRPRDPAGVHLEPAEAAVVAELFATYLEPGQTIYGLTKHLLRLQVPTMHRKGRWHPSTIRNILHNPVYTGNVYIGRTRGCAARQRLSPLQPLSRTGKNRTMTSANEWTLITQIPAVITQEQFDAVQAKLAHNQQFARRNNTAHAYLLRAMVSCGLCQRACLARTNGSNAYYVCRGKLHRSLSDEPEPCPSRMAPAGRLDELVWRDVETVIRHPEVITQALQRARQGAWLPQELQARQEQVRKATGSLEQQLERLTDAYLGAVIPLEEYRRRRQELEARQMSLARQAGQLQASMERQLELSTLVDGIEAFCARIQTGLEEATFEQRRQLVELVVDRVVVTNDEVEIRYVIPTTAASEHVRFCHLRADYFLRKAEALVGWRDSCQHAASMPHLARSLVTSLEVDKA
ncbi:MAG: recombinase family protein [Chloroflexota bacterium]|nr:recombinase family protein [Chloroflexota bacterium]